MVSGVILAGGASRRMGRAKAWIELGGKPFIAHVRDALAQVCDEIVIVTNEFAGFETLGARLVRDEFPNTGSLGGLYSGLNAVKNDLAFAAACDMPFLNPALCQFLISLSSDFDIVIPSVLDTRKPVRVGDGGKQTTAKKLNLHPLHAVYRKTCIGPMRDAIIRNDLRMISFHSGVRVHVVEQSEIDLLDPQHLSVWNVNTPEELERASVLVAQLHERKNSHA